MLTYSIKQLLIQDNEKQLREQRVIPELLLRLTQHLILEAHLTAFILSLFLFQILPENMYIWNKCH